MNEMPGRIVLGVVVAILVVSCQKKDDAAARPSAEPSQRVTNSTPIPQMPARDPSLPDAATALARDAVDEAKSTPKGTAAPQIADPQKEMTKGEESTAMPLPSQANDHSTTALDKSIRK